MSIALHIDPLSSPVGDVWVSMSGFSRPEPLIVMWSPIRRVVVEVEAAAPERSESEVSEPQYIEPDTSSLSLLCRIWIWLSQLWVGTFCGAAEDVFCLAGDEPLRNTHRYRGNRHARKMRARWARRMCPAARKARYGQGGQLRSGYSLAERRAWVQGRYPRSWFHWNHYKYYISGFFRRMALRLSRNFWARGFCGDTCHAPLWPD